jgi:hypothetical protein
MIKETEESAREEYNLCRVPEDERIVANISGSSEGAGFGRGGTPREIKYILYKAECDERRS